MRTNIRERLSIVEDCDPLADMERQNRLARRHRELLIDPSLGHFEGLAMRLLTQGGHQARNVRRLCRAARLELAAVELEADFHPYHSL